MPATIQGFRPDPRIRQTQLAELQRIYDEIVRRQQGAIVFLAGAEGSGRRATLTAVSRPFIRAITPVTCKEVSDAHPR